MYSKIIVGFDCSEASYDALAFGKLLAGATGAHLVFAGVFRVVPVWDVPNAAVEDWAPDKTEEFEAAAASAGGEAVIVPSTSAARGLQELAETIGADLIIVGSASHGAIGRVLAGNAGLSLLHGSPCSVAVAPRGFAGAGVARVGEVTVGFEGSSESVAALHEAADLARGAGTSLKVVTAAEPPPVVYGKGGAADQGWQELKGEVEKIMRTRMDEAIADLPDEPHAEGVLVTGDPADELARATAKDGGVLVVGSRSYGPLRSVLLGSVSRKLMRSVPCPLIVHPRTTEAERALVGKAAGGEAVL
jgi:nucleotide-binding universal stress UspA family protein